MSFPSILTRPSRRTVLGAAAGILLPVLPGSANARTRDISQIIFELTVEVRRTHNRGALSVSTPLGRASESYAEALARHRKLTHTLGGSNLATRATAVNYSFRRLGENIGWTARGSYEEEIAMDLVRRWMESPGHRRNILDPRFRELGVGVHVAGARTYAVQFFGVRA